MLELEARPGPSCGVDTAIQGMRSEQGYCECWHLHTPRATGAYPTLTRVEAAVVAGSMYSLHGSVIVGESSLACSSAQNLMRQYQDQLVAIGAEV